MTNQDRELAERLEDLDQSLRMMKSILEDITENVNQARQNVYNLAIKKTIDNKTYERTTFHQ